AHLAACLLHTAETSYGDIGRKVVADLGCGTGRLSIGASLLGAPLVVGFDVDPDALDVAVNNCEKVGGDECVDFVQCDLTYGVPGRLAPPEFFDTVVMNPPFGTKARPGVDMAFLEQALGLSPVVYSLHKTSTRAHVVKKVSSWGADVEVLAELRYDLPKTYRFHRQNSVDIAVDFLRVTKR
ncbi:unnamed protein product, partial [Cyprideis torosa]